jgi:putative aminopeptidase FrvX
MVSIDTGTEITESGFINSRHLDDKGGVASALTAARAIVQAKSKLPIPCHLLFTIFEEVGSGASSVLHGDVAEMVSIDNGTPGPGQNANEFDVIFAMMDSTGPFDYHLTHRLIGLANEHGIPNRRDVLRQYRCDAASALEAGNDIRTALACFGVDGSHGYERTHLTALKNMSELLTLYFQSPLTVERDRIDLGPLEGFTEQPM